MLHLYVFLICLLLCSTPILVLASQNLPPLMLAKEMSADVQASLKGYWLSEKYDGVRAYWNGQQLLTRAGNVINAPQWFTGQLPDIPMEGELWAGRGLFALSSGIVRQKQPSDQEWQRLKFVIFDLPGSPLRFEARQKKIAGLIQRTHQSWLIQPNHFQVKNSYELDEALSDIVASGGEGLMLNLADAHYHAGRSDALLKFKPHFDAEAKVVRHIEGKGRFKNRLGALLVRNAQGQVFKIGTGFSHEERIHPPKVGDWITYKYFGYTKNGLPRFASFLRVRQEP